MVLTHMLSLISRTRTPPAAPYRAQVWQREVIRLDMAEQLLSSRGIWAPREEARQFRIALQLSAAEVFGEMRAVVLVLVWIPLELATD